MERGKTKKVTTLAGNARGSANASSPRRAHVQSAVRTAPPVGWSDDCGPNHVLFVAPANCIRAQKVARGLYANGWTVDLLSTNTTDRLFYRCAYQYSTLDEIERLVGLSSAPVIHYHNQPNEPFEVVVRAADGRPCVFDVHDLDYHRKFGLADSDFMAFDLADALVFPGEGYRKYAEDLYGVDLRGSLEIASAPMEVDCMNLRGNLLRSGVMYQGHLTVANGNPYLKVRDLRKVNEYFRDRGVNIDWYAPNAASLTEHYGKVSFVSYPYLLREMAAHKWTLCGHEFEEKAKVGYPNKAFESIGLRTPILALNCDGLKKRFKGKCGIYASSIPELWDKLENADWHSLYKECIANAVYMEAEVQKLIRKYQQLTLR